MTDKLATQFLAAQKEFLPVEKDKENPHFKSRYSSHPWQSGLGGMHTGHFLAGRGHSIVFHEDNVAPQCSRCNRYEGGAPQRFRLWMLAVRGQEVIDRLEQLKTQTRTFTREELVDLRISYQARLEAAMKEIADATGND